MWAGVVSIVDVKKEEIHKKITRRRVAVAREYKKVGRQPDLIPDVGAICIWLWAFGLQRAA
jgi:hypothetical protein